MPSEKTTLTKPKLKKGREYIVEFYPGVQRVKAKYLGYSEREYKRKKHIDDHFFVCDEDGKKTYVSMSHHWMVEEEGVLTYNSLSSAPVGKFTERYLKEELPNIGTTEEVKRSHKEHASKLLNILRGLGEDI